jgi:integrase
MPRGERGTSRPYVRGKIWWIRYKVPGEEKERCESSKSTNKQDAVKLLNRRRKEIDDRQISSGEATVAHLLDNHLADLRKQNRKDYRSVEGYVRIHLKPAFGKINASRLTTEMIDRFIAQKQEQRLANASINRYLAALRRSFHLGMEALPPLVSTMPKIVMLEEDNVREGFLEHEQYVALRDQLPDHQKLILVIGYHFGMRRGEILSLRWDQVDWDANIIRLERKQTKGKQARVAPLYGEVRAWLEIAFDARDPECPFIVSWNRQCISEVKTAWNKARERAGIPALLVHDLRRTAVRNMVRALIPEKRAMLISGHKTRSVFDRYDITDERDIQGDGERLARYLEEKAKRAEERMAQQKVRTKVRTVTEEGEPNEVTKLLIIQ